MKNRVFSCPRNIHHAPLKIATTTPIVKKLSRKLTIVMPATLFIISEQNIHQFITFNFESCCYPKIPQYQRLAHVLSSRIFTRIVCDGFVSSFNALISFLHDWIYIMPRGYRDCMFRNEWLKDAKFKSLVGSD